MFRRILVPVGSHPGSLAAARLAARLAAERGGRLRACYVIDEALVHGRATFIAFRGHLHGSLEAEGRRALGRVRAVCRALDVPYSETLAEGDVTRELLKAARKFRADLVVMGTRGLGRAKTFVLGSLAHELVTHAPCPVLLVRYGTARRLRAPARTRGRRR